ncbi:MAG: VWA domain-containing protein [Candidatus Rokubacteria bacterium 13_2_20CM_2_70_11]|nr:MAG: VWA domain-containing protein [Candidatus Rokubacteria bacterium 13_2_20CM_2_70_11]
MRIRYSRWDGSQAVPDLDADDLLSAMSDDLMLDGDLWRALRRLFQQGLQHPEGQRMPGLQDLLKQLRQRRQAQLDRYDLGSALEDIKKKLAEVTQKEREGIKDRLAGTSAQQKLAELDRLPPDPAGQVRELQSYDFVDPEAKRLFDELMQSLRQQMLQPLLKGMQQALQGMTPEDLRRLREMLQDLNRMLHQRAEGEEPDFQAFKDKWGQLFPGAESLDELLAQLGRQMAQMQSLLESMSPGQRRELQELMSSLFMKDERLEAAMAQLAANLEDLLPLDELRHRYEFGGDEELTLREAMKLMEELQQMDQLERQMRRAESPEDLAKIDPAQVEKLLGEDAARDLDKLREIAKKLEEAGYLERRGDRLELTARAIRKIADKALRDIFTHLRRDRFGRHVVSHRGAGGDRSDDTKRYEFGDPFLLDLKETLMNAVERAGPGTPVRLSPGDFEVFRTELSTRAATVVMLDMSRSMINNGLFLPAKKVALALHALIRGQFPRDRLHIVGFSLYAREFTAEQLPSLTWTDWNVGTNMHAGFALSRQLLGREKVGNKQIVMITDGEPTAHLEGNEAEFAYPPTRRTLQETLKEVQRCTREGVTINTFMLDRSPTLTAFVQEMARINRGRAFFAAPERLGEYVLVDYVRNKRRAS